MCVKIPYPTRQEAFIAAKGIGRDIRASMKHYLCDLCGEWHISTRGKKAKAHRPYRDEKYPIRKKVKIMGEIVDVKVRR